MNRLIKIRAKELFVLLCNQLYLFIILCFKLSLQIANNKNELTVV